MIYRPRNPDLREELEELEAKYGPIQFKPKGGFVFDGLPCYQKWSRAKGGSGMAHPNAGPEWTRMCPWCGAVWSSNYRPKNIHRADCPRQEKTHE